MIWYLLLLCVPVVNCCQSICQKQYNLKCREPNVILFSAITSVIAMFFFLFTSGFRLEFQAALLPYSLAFAAAYSAGWVGTVMALRYGQMAITSLIISCSLIFPSLYGVLLGEAVTPAIAAGIVMLLAAFVLVNLQLGVKVKFSLKWFVCTMTAFFGNGVCMVTQNMQKRAMGDSGSHEFMILALAAASVILMTCAALTSKDFRRDLRGCIGYSVGNGVSNAVVNFLMILLIGNIPNTVLYPTSSALNMVSAFLLAFFGYKERFGKWQYVGYVLGVVSIVMLNM